MHCCNLCGPHRDTDLPLAWHVSTNKKIYAGYFSSMVFFGRYVHTPEVEGTVTSAQNLKSCIVQSQALFVI